MFNWVGLTFSLLVGCLGPATPLGSVDGIGVVTSPPAVDQSRVNPLPSPQPAKVDVVFQPARQNLHRRFDIQIDLIDPYGISLEELNTLVVSYNGLNVTKSVIFQTTWEESAATDRLKDQVTLRIPSVVLKPESIHHISVSYQNKLGFAVKKEFETPVCPLVYADQDFIDISFIPIKSVHLNLIRFYAEKYGYNPLFIAAVIGQESRFNQYAVSRAKALGLTQVTGIAEGEILRSFPLWPQYPGINSMSPRSIKHSLRKGFVSASNEWRFDAEKSIEGGAYFYQLLEKRWRRSDYLWKLVQATFPVHTENELQKLLLASYNSGIGRVAKTLRGRGRHWMSTPDLEEGRGYVNRILSYCDCFGGYAKEL